MIRSNNEMMEVMDEENAVVGARIHIYLPPHLNTERFPDHLYGDFSVIEDYKAEVSWTFFLMLRNQGMQVDICRDYPENGILVIHKGFTNRFVWNPNLFVVSMQWDYKRDDRAQIHLVSNIHKTRSSSLGWLDRLSGSGIQSFLPPPLHPTLIPRNGERGDIFKNMAFIGAEKNLAKQLRSDVFQDQLTELGMKFIIIDDPTKMNDYSEIDAVLAVRKIGTTISHKPAQKLINAWRAGVPAILGREVGYEELRKSDTDYLVADSVEEVVHALKRIKGDIGFRNEMIRNGMNRAQGFTVEEVQNRWVGLFKHKILPACYQWNSRPMLVRDGFLLARWMRYVVRISLSFAWHRLLGMQARS